MEAIKNILLYSGLNKEGYYEIRQRVSKDNRKTVGAFSVMATVAFILIGLFTIFSRPIVSFHIYLIFAAFFFAMYLVNRFVSRKYPYISDAFAIVFVAVLLASGVFVAMAQIDERTTILLPFFTLVSLLFCFRVLYLIIIMFSTEIVYLILINTFQSGDLLTVNTVNTLIFCLVGTCVGTFVMVVKYKKHKADQINDFLLERDPLTSLLNRRSYENELERLAPLRQPVVIGCLDINGLKICNDTKGHEAGDELIIGAAECISQVFGKYGKVFRTGGDEFCVLLTDYEGNLVQLQKQFKDVTKAWKGKRVDELVVSCGLIRIEKEHGLLLAEALQQADRLMYEDKHEYYVSEGKERRRY